MLEERKGSILFFRVETQEIGRVRPKRINIEEPMGTCYKDFTIIKGRHKSRNKADIDKDGVVNMADTVIVTENWLKSIED